MAALVGWLAFRRASSWLLVVAALMIAGEDGALSVWLPLVPPSLDADGLAGVAHEHARAHMLGAGAWTFLGAGLAITLARGPLRRGEWWAWRALAAYFGTGILVDTVAYALLYTHGLAVPLPGAHGGFGWPPVAVAFVAAGLGLALSRPAART